MKKILLSGLIAAIVLVSMSIVQNDSMAYDKPIDPDVIVFDRFA